MITANKYSEEIHPWKWYTPNNCRVLVVGTFPTAKKNWAFNFFYPNPKNLFWSVMAHLVNRQIINFSGEAAISERQNVLNELCVGITDMGYKVRRNNDSSLDTKLELILPMDIKKILDDNISIKTIILTSSSGKVSAYKWFSDYLKTHKLEIELVKTLLPFYGTLNYNSRKIRVAVLPSTSPAAAQGIHVLVSLYKQEIL